MFEIQLNPAARNAPPSIRCTADSFLVGASPDCLVNLSGWRVPPQWFRVALADTGIEIRPITDKVPVKIGNKVVRSPVIVSSGTEVRAGKHRVVIALARSAEDEAEEDAEQGSAHTKWVRRLHKALLAELDLQRVDVSKLREDQLRLEVQRLLEEVVAGQADQLPDSLDRDRLKNDVLNEAIGLGPLEYLLSQADISEIMVNRYDDIYIEQGGRLKKSEIVFSGDDAVRAAIERIVSPLGRRIDESSPLVDARLADGSRVNAVIPPLALRGPCITIRKFSAKKLQAEDLIEFGAATSQMMAFLEFAVRAKQNIVISGGTGSGKTTLLNVLSNFIPPGERVITVEDAAELKLAQPHLISLEARPPNIEGKGQVTIRDLVKNCLRMRPDRIVVGECRGGEALDMLQAMNTGHDGSLTTAHANNPSDLMSRLEVMVLMAGMELPVLAIREQIASAVDIVVQQSRLADGSRKISSICDVIGLDDGRVVLKEIMRFRQTGFTDQGRVEGVFESTGHQPAFVADLETQGVAVDRAAFGWT